MAKISAQKLKEIEAAEQKFRPLDRLFYQECCYNAQR